MERGPIRKLQPTFVVLACALLGGACAGDLPSDLDSAVVHYDTLLDLGNREIPVVYACDTVDVLFVVDNSNTMTEEQKNLVTGFPKLIEAVEALRVRSYRVGVISSDIGAGRHVFKAGEEVRCGPDGDGGKLQHEPRGASCASSYPKFLDSTQSTDMKVDFGCVAELGVTGCGYEQHLEAARLALTQQPYNSGFIRKNAPLALIFIADEDDCSAKDPNVLFDPDNTTLSHIRTRCPSHPTLLHPVSRYINAFRGLKEDPKRLLIAAITGPRGTVKVDPTLHAGQEPACDSKDYGKITFGNRFVELTEAFGDFGLHVDLCQGDLTTGLERIGRIIKRACIN